ncbi:MAG: hypothetical protein HONBIEJF_02197 [Fimbriimonadaceae bacterium]|nr:hypothetical protein [Fimbriimonadaceae bacterium]
MCSEFRVVEPLQRRSGSVPVTVDRHIADMRSAWLDWAGHDPMILVGSSWGAMLAACTAADHPSATAGVVMVGSGTWDLESRAEMKRRIEGQASPTLRSLLERRTAGEDVPRTEIRANLASAYTFEAVLPEPEGFEVDEVGNVETWADMVRLQAEGRYPQSLAGITCPVLMLHGAYDPHPGEMIRDSLTPYIPQLDFHQWDRCGHYPWIERHAREEFLTLLRVWINRIAGEEPR